MIDLHMHSEFSIDARDTPEALVERGRENGLTAMAITEHNNIDSLARGKRKAEELDIQYINGIELGGEIEVEGVDEPMSAHILGYFFNDEAPHILRICQRIHANGQRQTEALLAGLGVLNIPITREMVEQQYPGRFSSWAIRRMLREGGYACDKLEAMALAKQATEAAAERDARWHSRGERVVDASEVIEAIRADGGISFLAHPFWLTMAQRGGYDERTVWRTIEAVLALGADGLEAYNRGNDAGYGDIVLAYCQERGLPASGGSDSHGTRKVGAEPVDGALLDSMQRHRAGQPAWA